MIFVILQIIPVNLLTKKGQVKKILMNLIHKSCLRIFLVILNQKYFKIAKMRIPQTILEFSGVWTIAVWKLLRWLLKILILKIAMKQRKVKRKKRTKKKFWNSKFHFSMMIKIQNLKMRKKTSLKVWTKNLSIKILMKKKNLKLSKKKNTRTNKIVICSVKAFLMIKINKCKVQI